MKDVKIHPNIDGPTIHIIADISGSMVGSKIQRLRSELVNLWPEIKARLLEFNHSARWVSGGPNHLSAPNGSTNMTAALELSGSQWPSEVIVISDGIADDPVGALEAAARIPGTISVLFVGDDDDREGAEFMRRLARVGGGTMVHKDLAKNLSIGAEMRNMLSLPPPIAL